MPRTNVPVTPVTRAGVVPPAQVVGDIVNFHEFLNDGKTIIEITNTDAGAARDTTFLIPGDLDGVTVAGKVVSTPAAGGVRLVGPFPQNVYNQGGADAGKVFFNPTDVDLRYRAYSIGA